MLKNDYLDLIEQIKHHDDLYYNKSQPIITDSDYDKLYFKLQSYEKDHPDDISPLSPTQSVSLEKTSDKITHPYPLLSLKKANTYDEVTKYLEKFDTVSTANDPSTFMTDEFMVQLKEDGLTIALYYNWFAGNNFIAATRGGGEQGQNVSLQMAAFNDMNINKPVVIRGETILKNDAFAQMNESGSYMNPRNAVSGLLHTDAPADQITFVAYNIENAEDLGITSEDEMLHQLEDWGFTTPQLKKVFSNSKTGRAEIINFIQDFENKNDRLLLDHDIDGLVIKPNYISNRRMIGNTHHHPKNQLAYKFASPDAITTLKDVVWQSGAKGRLTPVAIFDPVTLLGANVEKASLANYDNIVTRDIKIHDKILVRRSNDVIPQIVKSFPEERNGSEIEIKVPENAHFDGKHLFSDAITDEQILNKWAIFVSKNGLDIKYTSLKTIKDLIDHNIIDKNDLSSLWNIVSKSDDLINLDGWSTIKSQKLIQQLTKPISTSMSKFLVALALNNVGPDTASKISLLHPTLSSIIDDKPAMTLEQWHTIVGNMSEDTLSELYQNKDIIKKLNHHIKIDNKNMTSPISNKLSNEYFVITGKSELISRNELIDKINMNGGAFQKTVSSKTTYVIDLSENGSSSSKIQKAIKMNIKVISLNDFNELMH